MTEEQFRAVFITLTGNEKGHFPWQWALYQRFATGDFPRSCNLPTGLGKTSVIALWLIALANHPDRLPRRLVYVVNRRTVVDQTTTEVEKLRDHLRAAGLFDPLEQLCAIPLEKDEPPLAISTLRGQFADNREWSADPARPAVIAGTVDMIGSRLLFSGYRVGFKGKPLHAGFLGQDVLLVHDEAHLEPAFQTLIEKIRDEQQCCGEFRRLHVLALSATSRNQEGQTEESCGLTGEEKEPQILPETPTEPIHFVWQRLKAKKAIAFHNPENEKQKVADRIGKLAKQYTASHPGSAVLIFVSSLEDHATVCKALMGEKVQVLTGTQRGLERDRMADPRKEEGCPIFARFLKQPRPDAPEKERWKVTPTAGTVFLVCTSAGEVGIDMSADHMVCDLVAFDRMAQRFGRVNRYGTGDAHIDIVHEATPDKKKENDPNEQARWRTLELLKELPQDGERRSASPLALMQLRQREDLKPKFGSAYTPQPIIVSITDILFDSWALTTIREELPGRPLVEPYLHGITERELPETYVAWREEVELLRQAGLSDKQLGELLADYPLKPHELLRDRSDRVLKHLASLVEEHAEQTVWLVDDYGEVETVRLGELVETKEQINWMTVVLPPSVGGLAPTGTLGHGAPREQLDLADQSRQDGEQRRKRIWDDEAPPPRMRLVRTIDTNPEADETGEEIGRRLWHWYVRPKSADDGGSRTASQDPVKWGDHTNQVTTYATNIAAKLCLPPPLQKVLELAGRFHDLGKRRELWQRSIGNPNPTDWHAKSGKDWKPLDITDYRHEFGSLLDVRDEPEFQQLNDDMKDLVLHLIAAHHGRGRPHFPPEEAFDPEPRSKDVVGIAAEVPRRFARLQRTYGRWGLVYLESLLRAADYAASAKPLRTKDYP